MSGSRSWHLESDLAQLTVLAQGGMLAEISFPHRDGRIEPFHRAPWLGESDVAGPPMLQNLQGDFFCAPFGANDLLGEEKRDHGLTANGAWRELSHGTQRLELELGATLSGARVRKEVTLRPHHPVVYQQHTFEGGEGKLPMGHHAMLRAPDGDVLQLAFSRTIWAGTPPQPVEGDPALGRSLLRYPQELAGLGDARTAAGEAVDLARYPTLEDSEEIIMLVTHPEERVAWSTAVAPSSGWLWFGIRPNTVLRGTLLWMSNGGRDYAPFLGRHRRVLGIEEVTSYFHLGHRASVTGNPLEEQGLPTSVTLSPASSVTVRYAFGAVPVPTTFDRVTALELGEKELLFTGRGGQTVSIPFDVDFLG